MELTRKNSKNAKAFFKATHAIPGLTKVIKIEAARNGPPNADLIWNACGAVWHLIKATRSKVTAKAFLDEGILIGLITLTEQHSHPAHCLAYYIQNLQPNLVAEQFWLYTREKTKYQFEFSQAPPRRPAFTDVRHTEEESWDDGSYSESSEFSDSTSSSTASERSYDSQSDSSQYFNPKYLQGVPVMPHHDAPFYPGFGMGSYPINKFVPYGGHIAPSGIGLTPYAESFFTFNPNGVTDNHHKGYFVPTTETEKKYRQHKYLPSSTSSKKNPPQPESYSLGGLNTVHIKGSLYHHALPKITHQRHVDWNKHHEPDKKVPIMPLNFKTQF